MQKDLLVLLPVIINRAAQISGTGPTTCTTIGQFVLN